MSLFDECVAARLLNDIKVPRIDGTKFSDYFFMENDKENWKLSEDFTNCIPPYEEMWIEFKAPSKIVSCEEGIVLWDDKRPSHWGWVVKTFNSELTKNFPNYRAIGCTLFEKYKDLPIPQQTKLKLMLCFNKQGNPCALPGTDKTVGLMGEDTLLRSLSVEAQKDLMGMYVTFFEPALLTMSYMNNPEGNARLSALHKGEELCQLI